MTERIEAYTILEVTDFELAAHLLINTKYTVVVADPVSPIRDTPHSAILIFCEPFSYIPNTINRHT